MNAKELREMTVEQLNAKLAELKEELFNLRFQLAINHTKIGIDVYIAQDPISCVAIGTGKALDMMDKFAALGDQT